MRRTRWKFGIGQSVTTQQRMDMDRTNSLRHWRSWTISPGGTWIRTYDRSRLRSNAHCRPLLASSPSGRTKERIATKDEFSVTPEEIETMSPEWKLAYVGRLVRNLALCYGVKTGDFGDQPPAARG
jgi:hypothetical protein